jgi:hypothetical protein
MTQINIKDESGDRKYFTQIPNYIANHSTANDQALYFQMKRYAGEDGQCFATQETLRKKLGIGKQAFNKSLDYLLKKQWIKFVGFTSGKTRPIKTYSIVDIWKLNVMEYEEISPKTAVSFEKEISPKTDGDKSQNGSKISPRMAIEEEPSLIRTNKKNILSTLSVERNKEIGELIDLFKIVNPSYKTLFVRKVQRAAAQRMLEERGWEELEKIIQMLPKTNIMQFAPKITTPLELEDKMAKLICFCQQEKRKTHNNTPIIL